jgi:hypothetical protein
MRRSSIMLTTGLALIAGTALINRAAGQPAGPSYEPFLVPSDHDFTQAAAERMTRAAAGHLAPVYAPLADYLTRTRRRRNCTR